MLQRKMTQIEIDCGVTLKALGVEGHTSELDDSKMEITFSTDKTVESFKKQRVEKRVRLETKDKYKVVWKLNQEQQLEGE